ncbi:MAG: hypothetical protein K9J37_23650 [Saprospiraceae bacterium]|nr:hypothetical protein [Saprospiraceae bacterium]MCF8252922.1 hypothetical protein [Saprospiraceae bacterium]MCF8281585.1 hypothetical protein [Bacteroidales bacterium]MCF8314464.1 hypothetical protein [Saprospiraceae bacterium]MCF8443347.1 hypothetical protein [Saprospiraceae bacterium]
MLQFNDNTILQTGEGFEKNWSIPELLETYDPLPGEPLADRNNAFQQIRYAAEEMYSELSPAALLRYDFWKNLLPKRIPEQRYEYTTKVTDTYKWELLLNSEGLYFKDISGEYGSAGTVYPQFLSDFWFCGPLLPLPDLDTRKWVISHIRNAFVQVGGPAYDGHFKLFEYPAPQISPQVWEKGDHVASDFVTLRDYGVEYGRQNWHDGLVYLNFLSFEHFLTRPDHLPPILTPEIRQGIHQHLLGEARMAPMPGHEIAQYPTKMTHTQPVEVKKQPEPVSMVVPAGNEESKRLFMENGGRTHYIHLDGDVYNATPEEEEAWRKELIENYTQRLKEETNETTLAQLVSTLLYNNAVNVKEMLLERAATANDRDKQTIAIVLGRHFDDEDSVNLLVSLLDQEPADYWRDFVFNSLFHMFKNPTAKRFIIQCLKGDNEAYFKKAVDVVQMWGYFGDNKLLDTELLLHLSWADKTANKEGFHNSLQKAISIIQNN